MNLHLPADRRPVRIVATSVALMLLVWAVVGTLGCLLITREERSARQQRLETLGRLADRIESQFQHRLMELEAWLAQDVPIAAERSPLAHGATFVWMQVDRIEVLPRSGMLYRPSSAVPRLAEPTQSHVVSTAAARVDAQAERRLVVLSGSTDPAVRTEARLTLASRLAAQGDVTRALAIFDDIERDLYAIDPPVGDTRVSGAMARFGVALGGLGFYPAPGPPLSRTQRAALRQQRQQPVLDAEGIPYALRNKFTRMRVLLDANLAVEAREEARRLASELTSGRWILDKATFLRYDTAARGVAGLPPSPPGWRATADLVDELWQTWRSRRQDLIAPETVRMYRPGEPPLLAVIARNADRLAGVIAEPASFGALGFDTGTATREHVTASVFDEHDALVWGTTLRSADTSIARSLSDIGIPWRLHITSTNAEERQLLRRRRNYTVGALIFFCGLVAMACYTIARGALRETAARRLQSDFVTAVSHEFRTPLTALRQLTELLSHGRVTEVERQRVYFGVLQRETARLQRLVEDLLDFGRMDHGRQTSSLTPFDVVALVRDAIDDYRPEAASRRHTLEYTADAKALIVNGDRNALARAVRNLLENAVKYSPDAPSVRVSARAEAREAVLEVHDDGIGIPAAEQARIFDRFVRGEAAKRACIPGTGIGLAMVHGIVSAHHGSVSVTSVPGGGSTFVVRLPLTDPYRGHES